MGGDRHWGPLVRGKEFAIDGDDVIVDVGFERKQRVTITVEADGLHLASVIARPALLQDVQVGRRAWERNRNTAFVGFRLDARGRLIGEAWLPSVGLSAGELQLLLRHVAAECDRFEHLLTGADTH